MAGEQDLSGLGGLRGPSDDAWVPTSSFPHAPTEGLNTPPRQSPTVLGTDQLQKAIDKFDKAVEKLEKIAQQMSGGGGFGSPRSGGGPAAPGGGSTNGGGATFRGSPIGATPTRAGYGLGGDDNQFPVGPNMKNGKFYQGQGLIGSGGAGYQNGGGASFGGQPRNANGTFANIVGGPGGGNGGGGSFGGGGAGGGQYNNGNGGFKGGGHFGGYVGRAGYAMGGTGGAALMSVGGIMGGLESLGESNLTGAQLPMSNMQQQGLLLSPNGTNSTAYGDQMRAQAFGSGRTGAPRNTYALNAQDASQGYSYLQQMSGAGIVSQSSVGRFGLGAAASFVGANPQLSYTQAAQAAQQMAMPSTSLRMMQMGYGTTPLRMSTTGGAGAGANSMGSVIQGMMQRWYGGKNSVSPQQMAAALEPGQIGYENLVQAGLDPTTMVPTMEAYNKVVSGSKGKINATQAQKLFQQAQGGNKQAQQTLDRYNVTQGDLGKMKAAQSQSTENQSDLFNSFSTGLSDAATSLQKFRQVIDGILNMPGVNQFVGGGEGALGGGKDMLGNVAGGAELGLGAFGIGKLLGGGGKSLLTKLPGLGGGGAAAAGGGEAGAAGAAGGAGLLGGAGIAGAGALGTILSSWLGGKMGSAAGKATGTDKKKGGVGGFLGNTLLGALGAIPGEASTGSFIKNMFGFSHGGRITDGVRGKDTQHAVLAKDEVVVNANAAHAIGYETLDAYNRAYSPGGVGGGTRMENGTLYAASGAAILSDAKKYSGHRYVYGGPSNPQDGWDCSSFASYVLGHDMKLGLPGGSWESLTNGGKSHGPVASAFAHLPGAHKIGSNPKDIQQGDVLVWSTHVGFGVGPGTMFSAYDTAQGTLQTPKNMANAGGPRGEKLTIMRYGSGGGTGGTGGGGTGSTSGSSASTMTAGTGGGYNAVSEAANVESALGSTGSGSINLGVGGSSSGPKPTTSPGGSYANKSGSGIPQNAQAIANYLSGKGANKIAIAGILGNIMQESGGDPNAGSNPPGKGLIQILGDPGGSLQADLGRTWNYIQQNGGIGPVNKATNAAQAATIFSQQYERPGNPQLSNRIRYANAAYAAGYASGTSSTDAGLAVVGERGPELVNLPAGASITDAGTTRKLMNAQGVAQAPWSAGGSGISGGGGINLTFGDLNVTITGNASKDAASNAATEIVQQVKKQLDKEQIYASIRAGNKRG